MSVYCLFLLVVGCPLAIVTFLKLTLLGPVLLYSHFHTVLIVLCPMVFNASVFFQVSCLLVYFLHLLIIDFYTSENSHTPGLLSLGCLEPLPTTAKGGRVL